MSLTYTDKNLKVVLHSWGRFRVTISEAVQPGDLLSFLNTGVTNAVQLANESDSQFADCIACEEGDAGDTIWACLKAELKSADTVGTGGVVTRVYFAGATDYLAAPLYLSSTDGKPSDTPGTTVVQQVGVLLARDRILLSPQPTFGADLAGVDFTLFGHLTATYMKWDSKISRLTIQKTYALASEMGSYDYAQYIGMVFNAAVPTGKYLSGLKIAVEGVADFDAEAAVWPLWIDYQNTGTNSSTLDGAIRISIQAGACCPDTYFALQSAMPGVEHLFRIAVANKPVAEGYNGSFGGTIKKISISIAGVEYFLVAATEIT